MAEETEEAEALRDAARADGRRAGPRRRRRDRGRRRDAHRPPRRRGAGPVHRPPRLDDRGRAAPRAAGRRRRRRRRAAASWSTPPGYRERRAQVLERQADEAADRAVRSGRPVALDEMTSSERRVVHEYLRDRGDVETHSEGDEPDRHLVVCPPRRLVASAAPPFHVFLPGETIGACCSRRSTRVSSPGSSSARGRSAATASSRRSRSACTRGTRRCSAGSWSGSRGRGSTGRTTTAGARTSSGWRAGRRWWRTSCRCSRPAITPELDAHAHARLEAMRERYADYIAARARARGGVVTPPRRAGARRTASAGAPPSALGAPPRRWSRGDDTAPTTVRDPARAVDVHVADSLAGARARGRPRGRGRSRISAPAPGFRASRWPPRCPETQVALVESVGRKCAFIERAIAAAGLGNASVVCRRAEEWDGDRRTTS